METLLDDVLSNDLPHSWDGDVREPLFTFSLAGDTYGFFFVSILQSIEIVLVLGSTVLVGAAVAALLFQTVIVPQRQDTPSAFLLGYGMIIPFWIVSPMYAIKALRITNKLFRFVMATVPTLGIFRTMEVIHGFCPPHLTTSMGTFCLCYASPFLPHYDHKKAQFVRGNPHRLLHRLIMYARGVILTGAVHSLYEMYPDTFIQFGAGNNFDRQAWYSWQEIFRWQRLWENLCFTAFFQIYLSTCASGLQLVTMLLTGIQLEEMWIDPVQKSVSFSDFWSRRWNMSVHQTLKRGVFLPVRRYFPKYVALVATFIASGLFHEWIIWLAFSPLDINDTTMTADSAAAEYQPTYGPAIVFFLFQASLIALEFVVGRRFKALTNNIPTPMATLLVVCIGGSMAHWFSDAYVHTSFFQDAQVAYIAIKRLRD